MYLNYTPFCGYAAAVMLRNGVVIDRTVYQRQFCSLRGIIYKPDAAANPCCEVIADFRPRAVDNYLCPIGGVNSAAYVI
jgi:hypothetical protein